MIKHELIRKYGYVAEVHSVTTSDGFVLEIHRIPGGKAFPPREGKTLVYLQHGILDTSAGWLLMGPHHGLGKPISSSNNMAHGCQYNLIRNV